MKTKLPAGPTTIGLILFVIMLFWMHRHFSDHAFQVAQYGQEQQEQAAQQEHAQQARATHENRLAWQKTHPAEYARQKAEARAEARRIEQQHIAQKRKALAAAVAAKEAKQAKERAAANARSASEEAEQSEVSADIPGSALVQSFTISDSTLALVVDHDVWDAMSRQDKKLFCGQVNPIWSNIYAKNHSGSSQDTNVMLFDLNGEPVTSVGACWVW